MATSWLKLNTIFLWILSISSLSITVLSLLGARSQNTPWRGPILNYYKVGFLPFFFSRSLPVSFPPPSRQSNLLILNISAKSSQIFMKFLGELSVGVPWGLKQKKQTNLLTNKQTNKQINIFPSNYKIFNISARSSPIFTEGIFLWAFQDD